MRARQGAIDVLTAALERGTESLAIAVVRGADGSGITQLLDDVRATRAGRTILRAAGRPERTGAALSLIDELTGRPDGFEAPDGGADDGAVDEDDATVAGAVDALLDRLAVATTDGPAVLVVHDLQWADRQSVEVLRLAVGRARHDRLTILVALRSLPDARDDIAQLLETVAQLGAVTVDLDPVDDAGANAADVLAAGPPFDSRQIDVLLAAAQEALHTTPATAAGLFALVVEHMEPDDVRHRSARTGAAEAQLWAAQDNGPRHHRTRPDDPSARGVCAGPDDPGHAHRSRAVGPHNPHRAAARRVSGEDREVRGGGTHAAPPPDRRTRGAIRVVEPAGRGLVAPRAGPAPRPHRRVRRVDVGRRASQGRGRPPPTRPPRAGRGLAHLRPARLPDRTPAPRGLRGAALGRATGGGTRPRHPPDRRLSRPRHPVEDVGSLGRGRRQVPAGVALAGEIGARTTQDHFERELAGLAIPRGDVARAEEIVAARAGRPDPVAFWAVYISHLRLVQGDVDAAMQILVPLVEGRDVFPEVRRLSLELLARAAFEADDDHARDALRTGCRLLTGDANPARVCRTMVLATVDGASEVADTVLRDLTDAPPFIRGGYSLLAGIAHRRAGQDERAVACLTDAHDLATNRGASATVRTIRTMLEDLGVRLAAPVPDRPATGWASITPAERRVVELVAEGLVYREIAERLFISRRTVESHVASALRKLGLRNRSQLATAFLTDGTSH